VGSLFLDKGTNISEIKNNGYEYYNFELSANTLKVYFSAGTPKA